MNKKSILLIIVLLIYALITFVIMMHHEIWGDEAQAWLVSRDLDFAGIIKHVRTEGHPLLWYFVILPFAKLNLPVVSMKIINWLIVLAGAGIFMWKAPFSIFSKISVLISSAFLYWFPALARSYCLVPLLLFLLAAFYKKQKEHPYLYAVLVILLAQTHVIMFAFCCALFVLFVLENRKKEFALSSLIIFCGLLSVFLYLCGSRAENSIVQSYHNGFSPELLNLIYKNVVFNIYNSVSVFYTVIFTAFCTFCAVLLLIKDRKLLFVWAFHHLYQFFIFVFIWGIIAQRAYTLLFVSLFCLWIIYEKFETKISKIVINTFISLTFLATLPACANIITRDWIFTFSDGKNAAEFIKNNFFTLRTEAEAFARFSQMIINNTAEIEFDNIYKLIQYNYLISDEIINTLKELEIQTEIDNLVPLTSNINKLKQLLKKGKSVVLISDMYHRQEILRDILCGIDPVFKDIPIYVSCEHNASKSDIKIF